MRFDTTPIAPTPRASLPPLPSGALLTIETPGLSAGLGGRLWPSAAALSRWLRANVDDVAASHVLELGCGCGAIGIYAAACGAASVLLTDGDDDLLQVAAANVQRNRRLVGNRCTVRAHRWSARDVRLPPQLDYVLGGDVTYNRQSLDPLCRSIRWMCDERRPRVLLAHEQRHPDGLAALESAAASHELQVTTVWIDDDHGAAASISEEDDTVLSRGSIALLEVSAVVD